MEKPNKALMRRGEVIAFLGINEAEMTKVVRCRLLKPVYLTPTPEEEREERKECKLSTLNPQPSTTPKVRAYFITDHVWNYYLQLKGTKA